MADSESGFTDIMDDMSLGDVSDTGYEEEFDVEIIDGFHYQNVTFMNEKVRLFADYWMKLYSNCCLQQGYALELLNEGKPDEAKAVLQDWPSTIGSPYLPQMLCENPPDEMPKRKKRRSIFSNGSSLVLEMQENLIRGERVVVEVPNMFPEGEVTLHDFENYIKQCEYSFKTVENYVIQNAFVYGMWLSGAFDRFQKEKKNETNLR